MTPLESGAMALRERAKTLDAATAEFRMVRDRSLRIGHFEDLSTIDTRIFLYTELASQCRCLADALDPPEPP